MRESGAYLLGVVLGFLIGIYVKFEQSHAYLVYACNFTTQEQVDQIHNLFDVQKSKLCTEWFGGTTGSIKVEIK